MPRPRVPIVSAALGLLLCVFCAGPAFAVVQAHRLTNGMQILVKEDHRAPVVVSMVWYRVGSMDEVTGNTGLAHVLEHMMFKGTREVPPGEFSRIMARAGGRDNAFTKQDATAYHQQLHKSQLGLALRLEADRMANLLLTDEEFAKEIRVVMEERRMRTDDQPRSLLYEAFLAAAYVEHPYRNPVVGWMQDLQNMTAEDARAWYRSWYTPNNATLVVVGDVSAQEVFAEAQKWFGPIPARALPVRKQQGEPAQRGVRRIAVAAQAELPFLLLGWHAPSLRDVERDVDPYALYLLAAILDGSDAARLPRSIVREQRLAVSVDAGYDAINRGPGLFVVSATPSPGHSVEELENGLRAEIRRIAEEGVSDEELKRSKAQAVAEQVFERDSMYAQAMQIGTLDNVGLPPDSIEAQLRRLQQVTAAQVQEVAKKYFGEDKLTVAVLKPEPLPPGARPKPAEGSPKGDLR